MINYWAILVCAVGAMILGALWYGALFGKTWARLIGAADMDAAKKKEMQKKAIPLYLLQLVVVFFQLWILASYSYTLTPFGSLVNSMAIYLGFVLTTIAGTCMWNNDSRKNAWTRFFVQAGYQLLCFVMFGLVLGAWQ